MVFSLIVGVHLTLMLSIGKGLKESLPAVYNNVCMCVCVIYKQKLS